MISIVILLLNTFAYNQPATYLFDAGLKFYWWFCILSLYEIFKQEALQPLPEESTMSMVQCSEEPNPDYASIPWIENFTFKITSEKKNVLNQ